MKNNRKIEFIFVRVDFFYLKKKDFENILVMYVFYVYFLKILYFLFFN